MLQPDVQVQERKVQELPASQLQELPASQPVSWLLLSSLPASSPLLF